MEEIHRRIIDFWPSVDDLAAAVGFKADRVRKWRQRGIPPAQWPAMIAAAKALGKDLTWEMLAGQQPLPEAMAERENAA